MKQRHRPSIRIRAEKTARLHFSCPRFLIFCYLFPIAFSLYQWLLEVGRGITIPWQSHRDSRNSAELSISPPYQSVIAADEQKARPYQKTTPSFSSSDYIDCRVGFDPGMKWQTEKTSLTTHFSRFSLLFDQSSLYLTRASCPTGAKKRNSEFPDCHFLYFCSLVLYFFLFLLFLTSEAASGTATAVATITLCNMPFFLFLTILSFRFR